MTHLEKLPVYYIRERKKTTTKTLSLLFAENVRESFVQVYLGIVRNIPHKTVLKFIAYAILLS